MSGKPYYDASIDEWVKHHAKEVTWYELTRTLDGFYLKARINGKMVRIFAADAARLHTELAMTVYNKVAV